MKANQISNHQLAKNYMIKSKLVGNAFEFEFNDNDEISLLNVIDKNNNGSITVPQFVTQFGLGDYPFSGTKFSKVYIDNQPNRLIDVSYLFGYIESSEIEVEFAHPECIVNMDYMFRNCDKVKQIVLKNMNTIALNGMSGMFVECTNLKSIDFGGINTSNVESMENLFFGCLNLENIDISAFDTSHVLSMRGMFNECMAINELNLSTFNTSLVTNMSQMFKWCGASRIILDGIDTSNVTRMDAMFSGCYTLEDINISNFNTKKVVSIQSLFERCKKLKQIDIRGLDLSNVINMHSTFRMCEDLETIDLSNMQMNNLNSINKLFEGCIRLKYINMTNFMAKNVCDLGRVFKECRALVQVDITELGGEVATLDGAFLDCNSLERINIKGLVIQTECCVDNIFKRCTKLKELDTENFSVLNPISAIEAFEGTQLKKETIEGFLNKMQGT